MFGKKKSKDSDPAPKSTPAPVKAGSEEGTSVLVGDQNDPNRKVVMKTSYVGTPDKDFRFTVDESLTSIVYTEEDGYIDEYINRSIQPSKYWEKKTFGMKKKDVSVLSFSEQPFTLVTGITFRVPGGDLDGTVRGSFKFVRGNPVSIASLLGSTYAEESTVYDVRRKYITAESLEKMLRTAFQDVIRVPLFKETIYSDLDDLQEDIKQKIMDTPFFFERSITVSEISVRPDRTEVEKLEDSEIKHKIMMRMMEMEAEVRKNAIESAKSESDQFKEI